MILRAAERFHTSHDGVESWHCFSAGGHYDPDNVAFGALVACDEHAAAPGAGFDWHAHRGVEIVSWVLAGELLHESAEESRIVRPGQAFLQSAGDGIRHRETNPSSSEPLRLVQMTLLSLHGTRFDVWRSSATISSPRWHAFVGAGSWLLGAVSLQPGDSVRGTGDLTVRGSGQLLVWEL